MTVTYDDAFNEEGAVLSIYPTEGKEQMQTIAESNKLLGGVAPLFRTKAMSAGTCKLRSLRLPLAQPPPSATKRSGSRTRLLQFAQLTPLLESGRRLREILLVTTASCSLSRKRVISQKLAEAAMSKLVY